MKKAMGLQDQKRMPVPKTMKTDRRQRKDQADRRQHNKSKTMPTIVTEVEDNPTKERAEGNSNCKVTVKTPTHACES